MVAAGLAGLALLALAGATVVVRPKVRLERTVTPDRVSVGEPVLGRLVVTNLGRGPRGGLVVVDRLDGRSQELAVPALRVGGTRTLHYPVPTDRRGRLTVGPLTIARRDPFGLFHRAQPQDATGVLWVHPRTHSVRPIPVGTVPDFEGRAALSTTGTTNFASLREYVPGDDPRRIHWRATARLGELIIRESVDTMEPTVTVVLDTRAQVLGPTAFEHGVELAASVAEATVLAGRPADVRIVGEDGPAVVASGAVTLLDRLAAACQTADGDPLRLLDEVDRTEPGGALVVVTSAGEHVALAKLAERRRRFATVAVIALPSVDGHASRSYRMPGLTVLGGRDAAEAAAAWNHFVLGRVTP